MNFYSFHIGDYARDTKHLSWDENAAYRFMIEAYYTREAPLPLERKQIYRLIGAKIPEDKAVSLLKVKDSCPFREELWAIDDM